jgi:hypothetical protein
LSSGPADALLTNVPAAPVNVSQSDPPNPGDVLKAVDGTHATWQPDTGGGGGGGESFPLIDGAFGPPEVNKWCLLESGPAALPGGVPVETRIGIFALDNIELTCAPGDTMNFHGAFTSTFTIPLNTYVEFSAVKFDPAEPNLTWIPRGMSNEAPGGGGGGGGNGLQPLLEGPLTPGHWLLAPGGEVTLPPGELGARVGVFAGAPTDVIASDGEILVFGTDTYSAPQPFTLAAGTYVEWSCVVLDGTAGWFAGGASNESTGGGGGGGDLVYVSGSQPGIGQWSDASNSTETVLPAPDASGQRVAIYCRRSTSGATVSTGISLQIDRSVFGAAETADLRPGGWYEWRSLDFGEGDIRWIPVGGSGTSARPPLEYPNQPASGLAGNQWVLSSDVSHFVNMPPLPQHGDVFGIYVDNGGGGAFATPATGQSIEAPDISEVVAAPDSLTIIGQSFYEWFWNAPESTWRTRSNTKALSGDGVAHALAFTDTPISLGGKFVHDVADPVDPQDVATKAWVEALLAALRAELLGGP